MYNFVQFYPLMTRYKCVLHWLANDQHQLDGKWWSSQPWGWSQRLLRRCPLTFSDAGQAWATARTRVWQNPSADQQLVSAIGLIPSHLVQGGQWSGHDWENLISSVLVWLLKVVVSFKMCKFELKICPIFRLTAALWPGCALQTIWRTSCSRWDWATLWTHRPWAKSWSCCWCLTAALWPGCDLQTIWRTLPPSHHPRKSVKSW